MSPRAVQAAAIAAIPVFDLPLDPPCARRRFEPAGRGPWQRKAMSMRVGQAIELTPEQADSFRGACRRLGIQVRRTLVAPGRVQVQVIARP